MRHARILLLALLALLVPSILFCSWLVFSTAGLTFLLNRFDHMLQVESVEGSLSSEFTLRGLDYESDTTTVTIEELLVSWRPSRLLTGNLVVDRIDLAGLQGRAEPSAQPAPLTGLSSPIDIAVKQVTGKQLSWNGQQINTLQFSGMLRGQTLQVAQLEVVTPELQSSTVGNINVGLRANGAVQLEQQLIYQVADAAPLSLQGRVDGNWSSLKLTLDIAPPYQAVASGTVTDVLRDSRKPELLITLVDAEVPLAAAQASVSGLSGQIKLNGDGAAIDTDLDLALSYTRASKTTRLHVLGAASIDAEQLAIHRLRINAEGQPTSGDRQATDAPLALPVVEPGLSINGTVSGYRAILAGNVDAQAAAKASVDIAAQWPDSSLWEALLESAVASPAGSISINGPLNNYLLAVDIDLLQKSQPGAGQKSGVDGLTGKLLATGSGDLQHFNLNELSLAGFVGTARGRGRLSWQDTLSWFTELDISDLRTEFFAEQWPGSISASLVSKGSQSADGLSASIKVNNISGRLRSMPLRAAVDLQVDNGEVQVSTLNARLGTSSVDAQGQLGENSDLSYKIVAPDLGLFSAEAAGSIDAAGRLLGKFSSPRVTGKANASQLRFRQWQIKDLNTDFDINLASGTAPWLGELVLHEVSLNQQKFVEKTSISLSGNALAHQLRVRNTFVRELDNNIGIAARWDAGTWSGSLDQLLFSDGKSNDWALSEQPKFSLSRQRQVVSRFCLRNNTDATPQPTLCAALGEAQDHQNAKLNLAHIPAALLHSVLGKYGFNIEGDIDAELEANFSLLSKYRPTLVGAIHSNRGLIKYRLSAAPSEQVVVSKKARPLDRQLEYTNFHLVVDSLDVTTIILAANLEEEGYLRGRISLDDSLFGERVPQAKLSGMMIAALPNLSMLAASERATVSVGGSLQANLNMAGTVSQPALDLNIAVTGGELHLPEAGVHLTELDLKVSSLADSRADISGSARAGDGEYRLDGQVNLADASEIEGQIKLVGTNVALVHAESLHADGNVALLLQLQKQNIDISGNIEIARGSVGASGSPGVVTESSDVIILSDTPRSKPLTTSFNIIVDLGDDMQINASGLSGRLTGKPRIIRSKSGILTSSGNITIVDGKFAAYGQKLEISKGQASYVGGELDNPALLVEATRTIQSTKVGISVTGSAENPEVALFSQPSMSDQDILSYLVFAKPIDELTSADGLRLLSIANTLRGGSSTSQLDLVSDRIATTFGLESVNLEFDTSADKPSLGIRSQITSKLEVGYGYNFVSSIRTILLRYKLTENWSIQSNIDVDSGADFKYQIETN